MTTWHKNYDVNVTRLNENNQNLTSSLLESKQRRIYQQAE